MVAWSQAPLCYAYLQHSGHRCLQTLRGLQSAHRPVEIVHDVHTDCMRGLHLELGFDLEPVSQWSIDDRHPGKNIAV